MSESNKSRLDTYDFGRLSSMKFVQISSELNDCARTEYASMSSRCGSRMLSTAMRRLAVTLKVGDMRAMSPSSGTPTRTTVARGLTLGLNASTCHVKA
jgi:hypothetical protein